MSAKIKSFNGMETYPFRVFTEITFTRVVEVVLKELYYDHNLTTCASHKKFIPESITLLYQGRTWSSI